MSNDNPYDPFGFGGFTAEAMNLAGGDTAIVAGRLRERIEEAFRSDIREVAAALESIANDLVYLGIYDLETANDLLDEVVSSPQLNSLADPSARSRSYLALASASDAIEGQHVPLDVLIKHGKDRTDPKDQISGTGRGRTLHLLDLACEVAREVPLESSERADKLTAAGTLAMRVAPDRVPQILEEARTAALTARDDMSMLLSATLHAIAKAMLKVDISRGMEIIDEAIISAEEENYGSVTAEELIGIADTVIELNLKRALASLSKAIHALKGREDNSESRRVIRKLRRTLERYAERNPLYIHNLLLQVRDLEEGLI